MRQAGAVAPVSRRSITAVIAQLQNTRAQIALMRPDPQTGALWEMVSDLMDLDDAHRYIADMLADMDVRYDLGDDHRLVGTLCPDMKLTLEREGCLYCRAVVDLGLFDRRSMGMIADRGSATALPDLLSTTGLPSLAGPIDCREERRDPRASS
ncbi:hypothetical protein SAZ11_48640 [Streptomyces sp. FXJ1.4098]|nr:hypothetical protein [Streptomyces sp. FXJ1.4098]